MQVSVESMKQCLNDADLSDEMKDKIMEKMSGKSQYEELLDSLSDNERMIS